MSEPERETGSVIPLEPYLARSNPPPRRRPLVPNSVLAMLVVVIMEVMFFGGLISAYVIAERGTRTGWPPPAQPRLPIEATALNTLALLASGVLIWLCARTLARAEARARRLFLVSMLLGGFFVVFQGIEWVRLIAEGLTLTYSTHAAFFYLIVGLHALHAITALTALAWAYARLTSARLTASAFTAVRIFWYFVVLVWPIIYLLVYL